MLLVSCSLQPGIPTRLPGPREGDASRAGPSSPRAAPARRGRGPARRRLPAPAQRVGGFRVPHPGASGRTRGPAATRAGGGVSGPETGAGTGESGGRAVRRGLPGAGGRGGQPLAAPQSLEAALESAEPAAPPAPSRYGPDLLASLASESRCRAARGRPLERRGPGAGCPARSQPSGLCVPSRLGSDPLPSPGPLATPQRTAGSLLLFPPRSLPATPHALRVWPVSSPLHGWVGTRPSARLPLP